MTRKKMQPMSIITGKCQGEKLADDDEFEEQDVSQTQTISNERSTEKSNQERP